MDPYVILGLTRGATDEEVKKAYRGLSRKFHPDMNVNNPNKEYAEEQFKKVQQAYQQIMKEKVEPSHGNSAYSWNNHSSREECGYEENSQLRAAGNYIRNGYYKEARNILDSVDGTQINARWYYYSAQAHAGLRNNVVAYEHAKKAVQLEPDKLVYRQLLYVFENGGNWYQSRQENYTRSNMALSQFCCRLCAINLCCNLCCSGPCCCFF